MIYLVHTNADADGLVAVDSPLSRSKLYHRLKALQPRDAPLLVAELAEIPKFKGMAPEALAWLRQRLPQPE